MKMTRQELKNIVKECLVEILSEGLVNTQKTITESRQIQQPRMSSISESQASRSPRVNTADKISFLPSRNDIKRAQQPIVETHKVLANSLTDDPVMADIFADTARSGAHRQISESSARVSHDQMVAAAGDSAAKVMLNSDPTDIFADSAGKWAALAFAEKMPARS